MAIPKTKTKTRKVAQKSKTIKKEKVQKKKTEKKKASKGKTLEEKIQEKSKANRKFFGKDGTIKEKLEAAWGPTVKRLIKMTPEEIQKEVEECSYSTFQKSQIGNLMHSYCKKEAQTGYDGPNLTYCYSTAQLQQYNDLLESLSLQTNKELQEILKKNNQPTTDDKQNLVHRIADGMVLGQIPKCPKCFGGRLKFNVTINNKIKNHKIKNKKGIYICPGFADGGDNCFKADDYVFCNARFKMNEIQREKWI